jgi:uncharacterized protein (DUF58 family)
VKLPNLNELLILRGDARGLDLRARGPAHAQLLGSHRSAHRGRGLEFEEVRPYVAGDDARTIDWRVTARRGRPHTKLFREERERPVWLLVDLHRAMFFGSCVQLKSAAAVRAAALLAWVAAIGGDRVGAVITDGVETRCLLPRSREAGVLAILNSLLDLQPQVPGTATPDSLHSALLSMIPLVHPGSLILTISDFVTLDERSTIMWSQLAAHSECRWFWITDALEQQALPNGRYRGGLPGRLWAIDGASIRAQWLAAWQERATRIHALAQRLRIPVTQMDTSQLAKAALESLLSARNAAA